MEAAAKRADPAAIGIRNVYRVSQCPPSRLLPLGRLSGDVPAVPWQSHVLIKPSNPLTPSRERHLVFTDPVSSLPLIKEGKLRALGVSTKARLPTAPDLPPLSEAGIPGFDASAWTMVAAPARTPKEIVDKLHAELKSIVGLTNIQQQMVKLGVIPVIRPPPEEFQPFINSEIVRWAEVVRRAGIAGSE